jgi:hypothetical protein
MKKSAIYFTKVTPAAGPGMAVLSGHMVDEEHDPTFTRFFLSRLDKGWGLIGDLKGDIAYDLAAVESIQFPGKTDMYALGRDGTLRVRVPPNTTTDYQVPLKEPSTYLEGFCIASDALYVCGGQRQVYRFANGGWTDWDEGLYIPFSGIAGPTLFAIVEVQSGVLLVVGSEGFAALRHGIDDWSVLASPTNVDLHCAALDGKGGVWIGGDGGTLLHLQVSGQNWEDKSDPTISGETFERLAVHKGAVYVAGSSDLLVRTQAGKLGKVNGPFQSDSEFHCVCSAGDYLWVTGDEHVYRLGPTGWEYLQCPDNI